MIIKLVQDWDMGEASKVDHAVQGVMAEQRVQGVPADQEAMEEPAIQETMADGPSWTPGFKDPGSATMATDICQEKMY